MMDFSFIAPTRVVFGCGTLSKTSVVVSEFRPTSVLVVTGGHSMRKHGFLDSVVGLIEASGVNVSVFDGVTPDPKAHEVSEGAQLARFEKVDLVVGLGGGSALDAAKGIAVSAKTGKQIMDFVDGPFVGLGDALPLVTVPSTAGTGSETSRAAIIVDDETGIKGGVRGVGCFPRAAIVDPELTLTVPRDVTFDTGFDALAHAIESYVSKLASPITDALAVSAMRLIYENLPKVVSDGSDLMARSNMSLAAMLMGFNIANSGTCTAHRMQYPLAANSDASHGRSLSALIPAWISETQDYAREKFGVIAEIFEADNASEGVSKFIESMGYKTRLRDFGVEEEMVSVMASQVNIKKGSEPREISVEDIEKIYEKAF